MINLDAVLPDIERAVADRVESTTLSRLDVGELRDLVYQLVARQHTGHLDPSEHFSALVDLAAERHGDMVAALDHSVQIRTELLAEILSVLTVALPSLLGPIVVTTIHNLDGHEERTHHSLLQGFELLNGEKEGPLGRGTRVRSGQSWWIVASIDNPMGVDALGGVDAQYAVARHSGCRYEHDGSSDNPNAHGGITQSEVHLVTTEEAATQIRDNQFEKLLGVIHARLVSLCGTKVSKATTGIWTLSEALHRALKAMKASP